MLEALKNTTATDRISLAPNQLRAADNEAPPTSRQTTGKEHSMRIVLVHGDEIVRLDMRELRSRMQGMKVVRQYPHCDQVLNLIKGLRPDLVVLDITVPGRRGLDALQSIRRVHSHRMSILLFERFPFRDVQVTEHANGFAYRFAFYQPARIDPAVCPTLVLQPELYGVLWARGH